ncbi:RNA polymerase sigma factor [Agreia sp. COWG]|uniref:RNA polymerase sigma factor n=1 Tax=Agreia sp. COWG TaxID=2773266 RepID=UPI0019286481|nr:RNA polymerase sigma factor [Agreia sp. COWG]CAD6008960.1 RNA polymerase sigma factor [Agreia sp. COWG]
MTSVPLSEAPDAILVGRAADGDVRAFDVLIRRYGQLMQSYARHLLGSTAESDDVVQHAFITAWQQLSTLSDPGAVKPWLMRIVNRKSLDRIRARRPDDSLDDNDAIVAGTGSDPEHVAVSRALQSAVAVALSALPENQRRCWLMKEIAGYSYENISEELGLPVSTVRGLLARARRSLIREMEPWR